MNAMRSKQRRALMLFAVLAISVGAIRAIGAGGGEAADDRKAPASERALAEMGRVVKERMRERAQAGEPWTPASMQNGIEWSRRICLAEVAAAGDDKAAKEKATADHLDTATAAVETLIYREQRVIPPYFYQQMRFYEEEAKLWVARAKAGKPIGAVD